MYEEYNTKTIGYCGVDSGQLFIADPCYIKYAKHGNGEWNMKWIDTDEGRSVKTLPDPTLENGEKNFYSKVCEANKKGYAEVELGVVMGTTYGDGEYAVQGIFDEDGEIQGIFMDFTGHLKAEFSYEGEEDW